MSDDQELNKDILQKIESGKVTMRPKSSFIWHTVLWVIAVCLLAAAAVFVLTFIIFILRTNGNWDLPAFGLHGLVEFLTVFPWLFVPALILFLWLLERFILRHSQAYRLPMLYSGGALILVVVIASLAVLATPLHHHLEKSGGLYHFFGSARPDDFYVGGITSSTPTSYTIVTPKGQNLTILKNSGTQIISNSPIATGDCVEIISEEQKGNQLTAMSIKKTDASVVENCLPPLPPKN